MKNIILSIVVLSLFTSCKPVYVEKTEKNPMIDEKESKLYLPDVNVLPTMPFVLINKNPTIITADKIQEAISKHASIEWLAEDHNYFLPTKENMDTIVGYLDIVFKKFGIHYIPEGTDCDDFARTKTALAKLILSQAYKIEASPAVFTIFVMQKMSWASVPAGGGHALISYACTDIEGNPKVYVWEPQSSEQIAISDYPNKDQLFYVGNERTENPNPTSKSEPKP